MRYLIWWLMDHACDITGHRVFRCWNGPGNRLWAWANNIGPDDHIESDPLDD
jgi:hypothetical protein